MWRRKTRTRLRVTPLVFRVVVSLDIDVDKMALDFILDDDLRAGLEQLEVVMKLVFEPVVELEDSDLLANVTPTEDGRSPRRGRRVDYHRSTEVRSTFVLYPYCGVERDGNQMVTRYIRWWWKGSEVPSVFTASSRVQSRPVASWGLPDASWACPAPRNHSNEETNTAGCVSSAVVGWVQWGHLQVRATPPFALARNALKVLPVSRALIAGTTPCLR